MLPNGGVESTLDRLPGLGDCDQGIGIHEIDYKIEYRSRNGIAVYIWEEGEKRKEKRCLYYGVNRGGAAEQSRRMAYLVKDTTIVGRNISSIEIQSLLYYTIEGQSICSYNSITLLPGYLHRLKLLTGVDTSTRPVSRSGNDGNRHIKSSRRTKATPNTPIMRLSTAMLCSVN
jgi:hypothetical protein